MNDHRYPVLCDHLECTGCEACRNVCPKDAIEMRYDQEGFLQPFLIQDKCIKCLACEKTCPVLSSEIKSSDTSPTVYASWNKDADIRKESSSGGAFSAIASGITDIGGYVVGASYDVDMHVRHIICNSGNGIKQLRGSKYVQSEIGDTFRKIKRLLNQSHTVLFVGTPCQVSGLRSYLRKEYENLFCLDFICHGTPSPLLFKKYIEWIETNKHIKIHSFNFRSKHSGWYDALRVANGDCFCKNKYDAYFYGFNKNLSLRESCYRCPAIGLPRKGDLTIGDFWGIGMYSPFEDADEIPKGISLLMVNNQAGERLFELAKPYLHYVKRDFDEALNRNKPMIKASYRPASRDNFYHTLNTIGFEGLRQQYLQIKGYSRLVAIFREYAPKALVVGLRSIIQQLSLRKHGSNTI